jgi:uncharacterized protein with PIN domain
MKASREEKKARLMVQLEKAAEELLDWEEQNPRPTLTQLEDIVLMLRKQIGEEMAEEVIERMEAKAMAPGPRCPKCGKEMRYKGQREKDVESRAGELTLERGYYACPDCDEGFFPPG